MLYFYKYNDNAGIGSIIEAEGFIDKLSFFYLLNLKLNVIPNRKKLNFSYFSALSPSVPNPCKNVCSHLCLLRPGGYTCACPQGSSQVEFDSTHCDAGKLDQQSVCMCCLQFSVAPLFHSVFFCPFFVTVPGLLLCYVVVISVCFFYPMLNLFAAIEPPNVMPLACRCMNGGTCYTDEGGLPKCK